MTVTINCAQVRQLLNMKPLDNPATRFSSRRALLNLDHLPCSHSHPSSRRQHQHLTASNETHTICPSTLLHTCIWSSSGSGSAIGDTISARGMPQLFSRSAAWGT